VLVQRVSPWHNRSEAQFVRHDRTHLARVQPAHRRFSRCENSDLHRGKVHADVATTAELR